MDNKMTDELLQQLHDVIQTIDTVDEKGCELLEDLDGDIQVLLERSGEHLPKMRASAMKRMERSIDYFEATHPDLTELLAKVMSSLSNAGI